jgi:antitoxin (DNA-binding transcriptional repressor) of toxin-antitoxin stability system
MGAEDTRASGAYSIHEAKTQFSKLIRRGPKAVAKLVPLPAERRDRGFGSMKGRIWIADDFDEFIPPEFDEYLA